MPLLNMRAFHRFYTQRRHLILICSRIKPFTQPNLISFKSHFTNQAEPGPSSSTTPKASWSMYGSVTSSEPEPEPAPVPVESSGSELISEKEKTFGKEMPYSGGNGSYVAEPGPSSTTTPKPLTIYGSVTNSKPEPEPAPVPVESSGPGLISEQEKTFGKEMPYSGENGSFVAEPSPSSTTTPNAWITYGSVTSSEPEAAPVPVESSGPELMSEKEKTFGKEMPCRDGNVSYVAEPGPSSTTTPVWSIFFSSTSSEPEPAPVPVERSGPELISEEEKTFGKEMPCRDENGSYVAEPGPSSTTTPNAGITYSSVTSSEPEPEPEPVPVPVESSGPELISEPGPSSTITRKTWSIFSSAMSYEPEPEPAPVLVESSGPELISEKEKTFGKERPCNGGNGSYGASSARKKGKSSNKVSYVCSNCGYSHGQWWGSCRECKATGTLTMFNEMKHGGQGRNTNGFAAVDNAMKTWLPQQSSENQPVRLVDVNREIDQEDWRISLTGPFGAEVSTVLGGGLVPGSLVLVGGDPGVGKSTLLLQIASMIAEGRNLSDPVPVVYVSGEESIEQIGIRADRIGIQAQELFLFSSTDIEDILDKCRVLSPRALVVDSIQTVYLNGATGSAGSLNQVKECTSALLQFSKRTGIPVLLAGHVTKSGDVAGPKVLEHIVDVVLYMEGDKDSSHRLLRTVKNRFGSTDELGIFEMSQRGLQAVKNPSKMFLGEQDSESKFLAGKAVAVIMDGSRSFLLEIQALVVPGSTITRQVNGVPASRADMIISVLMKQKDLKLQGNGILLNVVSGVPLSETAGDLAVAVAILSSSMEIPIPGGVAFIGEIDLSGGLREVPRIEKRVSTVAKLGYKMCIVPESSQKYLEDLGLEELQIVGCSNLKEVIEAVFR